MTIEYFVIIAGRSHKDPDSEISMLVANSVRQAHEFATKHYREQRKLPSSVHVFTKTLYSSDKEEETYAFMNRLFELIKKKESESST